MGITRLIIKEISIELRQRSVILGICLFLASLTFICYLTFSLGTGAISPTTWSALYWLTIMFSVVNTVAKSFVGERKGLALYYYTIASPGQIIIAKIIYNSLLSLLLSVAGFLLFRIFLGNPPIDTLTFVATLLLTSIGFSSALTLISGIAAKASHSHILMAVLSFPIILSILLMAIRITKNLLDGLEQSANYDELLNLVAINCILATLAYILFPYIWRS